MARHVVIIGGGFGGLATARALRKEPVQITLIDRRNHHLFQPLLYQVATAGLAPSDIAEPIRGILAGQDNVTVRLAEARRIDLEAKQVLLEDGARVPYDTLVVAAGAGPSYFGHPEWSAHAPSLKTIGDALDIRRRVLQAFEEAEWTDDSEARQALLTFVVVGGGPTGVELAGALAEIAFCTLRRDFRRFDPGQAKVILVEGAGAVLPPYPAKLQASAKLQLESLGVEVRLKTLVKDVDADGVVVGDERIRARTVLWAAGVQGAAVGSTLDVPLTRTGQVKVSPHLTIPGHDDVFVIGDLAHVEQPDGSTVPGVAQGALQMGSHVGAMLAADRLGRPRSPFRYGDKGNMATIGRRRAVMDAMGLQLSGVVAWLAWVIVHLFFLVTYRNRLLVFTKWAWAWVTFERASRLIWQDEPGYHGAEMPSEADRAASGLRQS
jgi:NADH dehydrogenase